MYTALLLDGNLAEVMPDLMRLDIDQMLFAQPHATGLDVITDYCRGKRCVKLAVDMMDTLATGTPAEIEAEVDEYVAKAATPKGGLVFQALRWHRPEYAAHEWQGPDRRHEQVPGRGVATSPQPLSRRDGRGAIGEGGNRLSPHPVCGSGRSETGAGGSEPPLLPLSSQREREVGRVRATAGPCSGPRRPSPRSRAERPGAAALRRRAP